MDLKPIIQEADTLARREIAAYHVPSVRQYELSNRKGQALAQDLGADQDIVALGTRLMDVKLGEAFKGKRLPEHVAMSKAWTIEFLNKHKVPEEEKEKIVNCVEGHHKQVPWTCKEAEICANADCYRFLQADEWLQFLSDILQREMTFPEALAYAQSKAEEKWQILSLEPCKKEIAPHYAAIKEILRLAQEP